MRFAENGPNIPDDLLNARDEGRVIFFCGAGVSLARANLPDFYGLTEKVITDLKVQADSKAFQLYNLPSRVERDSDGKIQKHEISPFISADRIFGELERDFEKKDIEQAVANCLKTNSDVDLSSHQIILNLATGPSGRTKLVTTNFDRLFEKAKPGIPYCAFPNLPDLSQTPDFDGVVYLHGHTNGDCTGAGADGFILSSADFGQAYLANGSASRFIKTMLETHTIVFLGYSADDPPVRYLLEALGRFNTGAQSVYAFQSGTQSEAEGLWTHKGVNAIAYDPEHRHSALWETLNLWADRAVDPDKWFAGIIQMAAKSPRVLRPFERGQVAHMVSSIHRSRLLIEAKIPPPGEWLYVFDPNKRYGMPSRPYYQEVDEFADPFVAYSLDSDHTPARFDPEDINRKTRETPKNAWSAFNLTHEDRMSVEDHNIATYAELGNSGVANLPKRLFNIGVWIAKVAADPATLAWCVSKPTLHKEIIWQLERRVEDLMSEDTNASLVSQWQYLLEYWKEVGFDAPHNMDWYRLKKLSTKVEWSEQFVRRYGKASRPYMTAQKGYELSSIAPDDEHKRSLVRIGVKYPKISYDINVPVEWLSQTVSELGYNLRYACKLRKEIGPIFSYELVPINKGDDPTVNKYTRGDDLSALMLKYVDELEKLIAHDVYLAKAEIDTWPAEEVGVFSRLRIWASGKVNLVPDERFVAHFDSISTTAFWHPGNQRDILLSFQARWSDLSEASRSYLETRILEGPIKDEWDKSDEAYFERRARRRLNMISWLNTNGCDLNFDEAKVIENLKQDAPEWEPRFGEKAADEKGSRGGFVRKETAHNTLIGKSFDDIFSEAESSMGRTDDVLVENDPFLGFVGTHPVRALAALSYISKNEKPPIWAWKTFFNHEQRKEDPPRFSRLILAKLLNLPLQVLTAFIYQVTWWFRDHSSLLSHIAEDEYDKFFDVLFDIISKDEKLGGSKIVHTGRNHDWASEALNSSVGHLVDAHFFDRRISSITREEGIPKYWQKRLLRFLDMTSNLTTLAITEISARTQWIHYYQPKLSLSFVEGVLSSNNENAAAAFWGGFFLRARIPDADLFAVLKPYLISLVESQVETVEGFRDPLAGLILGGWRSSKTKKPPYLISDEELTSLLLKGSNAFRTSLIYHAETWSVAGLEKEENDGNFPKRLTPLFKDVWPQQITARTSSVSSRLFDFLTSNEVFLLQLYELVLPLLVPVEDERLSVYFLEENTIVDKHPMKVLYLVNAILPKDVKNWPYGAFDLLSRLKKATESIGKDAIYLRLMKKYESR